MGGNRATGKQNSREVCLNRAKDRTPGVAEFEVIIARQFWGRRLGRAVAELMLPAAFYEMNAIAVLVEVHPENLASLAMLKNSGFTYLRAAEKKPMDLYELRKSAYNA